MTPTEMLQSIKEMDQKELEEALPRLRVRHSGAEEGYTTPPRAPP